MVFFYSVFIAGFIVVVMVVAMKEKFESIVFRARISRSGGGLVIWIPKHVRELYDLEPGLEVKVRLERVE